MQSPLRWSDDASWKLDYNNLAKLTPEELAERRKEFEVVKAVIKTKHGGRVSKPFAGVRILDFTRYLAGPYGTYQLALLGADVVKIESRDGDETRSQLVVQGVGGAQDAARLPGRERQQAQHHARPAAAGGDRGRQAPRGRPPTWCGRTSGPA